MHSLCRWVFWRRNKRANTARKVLWKFAPSQMQESTVHLPTLSVLFLLSVCLSSPLIRSIPHLLLGSILLFCLRRLLQSFARLSAYNLLGPPTSVVVLTTDLWTCSVCCWCHTLGADLVLTCKCTNHLCLSLWLVPKGCFPLEVLISKVS